MCVSGCTSVYKGMRYLLKYMSVYILCIVITWPDCRGNSFRLNACKYIIYVPFHPIAKVDVYSDGKNGFEFKNKYPLLAAVNRCVQRMK